MSLPAEKEIDRLAKWILKYYPDEPGSTGKSESAVDVAIRLMRRLKKKEAHHETP